MITISPAAHSAILAHACKSWPRECCGLLAGETNAGAAHIRRAAAARNVDASGRNDRFELDPQARFDLMRKLEGGPETLLGHYHSHPDGPAAPSETDRAMAFEPDLIWLICAVRKDAGADGPNAGPVRAFRITNTAVESLDLMICEGNTP